jgi:transcriptional regulator with XRE-family HTH domain
VDAVRLGRQLRALRIKRGLRQEDLGRVARVSRAAVSKLERGLLEAATVRMLVAVASALGASVDVRLRWNGEQLDRLLDANHASLVEIVVAMLGRRGWELAVEVSFAVWGERGSIDVLAYHPGTKSLLVVEVKSVVADSQATLHTLDRKVRLARQLAMERGWECRLVSRLVVIGSSVTSRRRIDQLATTYRVAFPDRGSRLRDWLRAPRGSVSGLLFVSYGTGSSARSRRAGVQRVRRQRTPISATGGSV